MAKCSFCSENIPQGRGKIFVAKDGRVHNFCSRKCEKSFFFKRNPRKVKWVRKQKKSDKEKSK